MSEKHQRHRKKARSWTFALGDGGAGLRGFGIARDDPLKAIISAEHDLDVMCRAVLPRNSRPWKLASDETRS